MACIKSVFNELELKLELELKTSFRFTKAPLI